MSEKCLPTTQLFFFKINYYFLNSVTEIAGSASNLNHYVIREFNTYLLFFFLFCVFKFVGVRVQESQEQEEHNGEKSVSTNYP